MRAFGTGSGLDGPRTNSVAVTAVGSWSIYRWGWQYFTSERLNEAYVSFFGAFGAAWDDGMVARWSANPLGMLWPEMDAALATSGGENGGPAGRGAAVGRSAGPGPFKRFHIEGFAGRRDFLIEASGGSSISPTAVGPNRNCSMGRGVPKSTA